MKSRVLLVNFNEKEADAFRKIPLIFERGYISDVDNDPYSSDKAENFKFFFPHSIFEYKVVVIRLGGCEQSESEFASEAKDYDIAKKAEQFHQFMRNGQVLIFVLGDYSFTELYNFGVKGITLENVSDKDISINSDIDGERSKLRENLKNSKKSVVMPTQKYICSTGTDYEYNGLYYERTLPRIYTNNEGRILGALQNRASGFDKDTEDPTFIVLPEFKNTPVIVRQIINNLADCKNGLLPELYSPNWQGNEFLLPQSVSEHQKNIDSVIKDATKAIDQLRKKEEEEKEKYSDLVKILTTTGDDLVLSVRSVLENYFNIKVTDVDEEAESAVKNEDLLLECDGRKILVEVKGDKAKYPKQSHVTQVWKHLKRNPDVEEGALIINYDWDTEPTKRNLAYTGEDQDSIQDIIFIDTRELHKFALAIIDKKIKPKVARKHLLALGRAKYEPKKK